VKGLLDYNPCLTCPFIHQVCPSLREAGSILLRLRRLASGLVERLTVGGLPLGIKADTVYESARVILQPGDWLVIFTDGLVEAENENLEEYGEPRLLTVVEAGAATTPEELLRRVMTNVDSFVGATPQHDDITCMVVKVE
jgi:phosphoserine phosphatase RsbU/P